MTRCASTAFSSASQLGLTISDCAEHLLIPGSRPYHKRLLELFLGPLPAAAEAAAEPEKNSAFVS